MSATALDRLRAWMEAQAVSRAYLTSPVSIAYLTGFRTEPGERTLALVVAPERALLIVPEIEREAALAAAGGAAVQVVGWRDGDDPYHAAAQLLASASPLAVEKAHLSVAHAELLARRFGATQLMDAGAAIAGFRLIKSPEELGGLADAAKLTDRVVDEAVSRLRTGMSELQVGAMVASLIAEAGARPSFDTIAQCGPNTAMPHLRPTGRRLQDGDLVLLDLGAAVAGYHGDITRMAVLGQALPRQLEVHEAVLRAHDAALEAIRPGVSAGEVDQAARRVLGESGLGEHFIHRVGHGLGLECHEAPSLDPGSQLVLEEGMVVTVEPGAYIPGWGGVRIEDDVVVGAGGARLLTASERSLRTVPR